MVKKRLKLIFSLNSEIKNELKIIFIEINIQILLTKTVKSDFDVKDKVALIKLLENL